ncbi:MAG: hypothetical protein HY717_01800 [Planctomycetes bacterium]|nr:hypothetical protein [Planctomycetota bacterium]
MEIQANRGAGPLSCTPLDTTQPVTLLQGENELIVKVFDGFGGWDFTLRFEDELGNPITDGLTISKYPEPGCRKAPYVATRTLDTGQTVRIGRKTLDSWNKEGITYPVSIAISDIRQAGGDCGAPTDTTVTETVPDGWAPSDPSPGGIINGQTVTWNLNGANIAPQTLTYRVTTGAPLGNAKFSGNVSEPGNLISEFPVIGEKVIVYTMPRFPRGAATVFIDDNFDEHVGERGEQGECPNGWTCNVLSCGFGISAFKPGVTKKPGHQGRLRLANESGCPNGVASTVIWNDPVDLSKNSLSAEFDVFFEHKVGTNPPADGLTFMVLDGDDPLNGPTARGAAGGGMGFQNLSGFALEFDLWDNDGGAPQEPSGGTNAARPWEHIGLLRGPGPVVPHVQTNVDLDSQMIPTSAGGTGWPWFVDVIGSGVPLHCEVDYNNSNLQVFLSAPATVDPNTGAPEPAFPRTKVIDTIITFTDAITGELFALNSAYLGFSAGTGGAWAVHEVDNVKVTLFDATAKVEICNNQVDDDGDQLIDCADPDCANDLVSCPPKPKFRRGDLDASGVVDISDPINGLHSLFLGDFEITCQDSADFDDSGQVDITDMINSLLWQFGGGGVAPAPGPFNCGVDPTDDRDDQGNPIDLGCSDYTPTIPCQP